MSDFVIESGILKKYIGNGGDVEIPSGVTRIGESAFTGCTGLTSITIPSSATSIDRWAFFGCNANMTIYAAKGTYAETYAKENGFRFAAKRIKMKNGAIPCD